MHYYKRNIGDYAKKAGRLSMLEHGAYTLLIDACYDREQFPTLEEALDWAWARTEAEESAVKFVLAKFFVLVDGVYIQKRIKEELAEYKDKAETNGRIAKEREEKRKLSKRVVDDSARTVNESCEKTHEPPPNQEPITNNQEPINNNKNKREENFQKSEHDFIDKVTTDNKPKNFALPLNWNPDNSLFCAYCLNNGITPNQLTTDILKSFCEKANAKGEVKSEAQWCLYLAKYLKTCLNNLKSNKTNPHLYQPEQEGTQQESYKPNVASVEVPTPLNDEERQKRREELKQMMGEI